MVGMAYDKAVTMRAKPDVYEFKSGASLCNQLACCHHIDTLSFENSKHVDIGFLCLKSVCCPFLLLWV